MNNKYMISIPKEILPVYGAICGDIIGSRFERGREALLYMRDYPLLVEKCRPTDDTVLTIGVAECLLRNDLAPRRIAHYLRKWGRRYPRAGFGSATKEWLRSKTPVPYNSNRNGAAMRVSPCGVFAKTLAEALSLAEQTAAVSHNHPEGIKGAQAIAAAIFLAAHGASKDEIREYTENTFAYDLSRPLAFYREHYSGFSCKAADTVPQSIAAFLESTSVETAIRNAIQLGSDADTMADMAGAIAAAFYKEIPFLSEVLPLIPEKMRRILDEFGKLLSGQEYDAFIDRK